FPQRLPPVPVVGAATLHAIKNVVSIPLQTMNLQGVRGARAFVHRGTHAVRRRWASLPLPLKPQTQLVNIGAQFTQEVGSFAFFLQQSQQQMLGPNVLAV